MLHEAERNPGCRGVGTNHPRVNPKKLETVLRRNSAGTPYTLLLGIEAAIEFPTFLASIMNPKHALKNLNHTPELRRASPYQAE